MIGVQIGHYCYRGPSTKLLNQHAPRKTMSYLTPVAHYAGLPSLAHLLLFMSLPFGASHVLVWARACVGDEFVAGVSL